MCIMQPNQMHNLANEIRLSSTVTSLMNASNRRVEFMEFQFIMNMSRDMFLKHLRKGLIPHFPLKPYIDEDDIRPKKKVFYNKDDWYYNNRHLLEYLSLEEFLGSGEHIDFIFRENGRAVDLDMYMQEIRDLAALL